MTTALRFDLDQIQALHSAFRKLGAFLHPRTILRGIFGVDSILHGSNTEE